MFAYKVISIADGAKEKALIEEMNNETHSTAKAIETFLSFLWFIKDNSISADDTYGYITETLPCGYSANHTIFINSSGGFESVHFSEVEINRAANILFKYIEICPDKSTYDEAVELFRDNSNVQGRDIFKSGVNLNKDMNNIQRAITFLSTARSSPYLPYKIALYMPILESLFCVNDSNEVTQKVSERVAFYIGKENNERKKFSGCKGCIRNSV